ncbi:Fis family transcriptional regulator [Pigmentiphaga soli]|uniref:Putative Fis-like DNA-binding protein n=1 Tax=Pigmentiphaga soli TaxID=1007095 RepID=A0ABP8HL10_9BURK
MKEHTLEECVRHTLERYFRDLDGESPSCIWDMVQTAIERPMLEVVLQRAQGNQSRAADMLGINRNTLRKKLDHYQIKF